MTATLRPPPTPCWARARPAGNLTVCNDGAQSCGCLALRKSLIHSPSTTGNFVLSAITQLGGVVPVQPRPYSLLLPLSNWSVTLPAHVRTRLLPRRPWWWSWPRRRRFCPGRSVARWRCRRSATPAAPAAGKAQEGEHPRSIQVSGQGGQGEVQRGERRYVWCGVASVTGLC